MPIVDTIKMPNENEPYNIRDKNVYTLLAPEYDSSKTYHTGDYCIHDYVLYKCNAPTDAPTTGDWDLSKWDYTTIIDIIKHP